MNIHQYVRQQESRYESDTVTIAGVSYNQKKRIIAAELASLATYKDDNKDPILGHLVFDDQISDKAEKEAQILDFDRKHLDIAPEKPTSEARWKAAFASHILADVMDEEHYGSYFNKWSRTYTKYGGALSKMTKTGPEVVSWHNVITDQTDILNGVIIERHYYTPSQLKGMSNTWQNVDQAIRLAQEEKESTPNSLDRQSDTQGHYIEIHEIHGEVSMDILEDGGDPTKFKRVFMVIAGVNQEGDEQSEDKEIILYETDEKERPYMYLARNPIDGVALGRGIYEELLPQQVAHNFLFNEELKFAAISNIIYVKTNKSELPSSVAKFDQLSVFKLDTDEYVEFESPRGRSLPAITDLRDHIRNSMRNRVGQQEAITGEEGKAGKTLGLHKLQNIEGHSRFRPKRQDIGFHHEEMIRKHTLPRALKKYRSKDAIFTTFTDAELIELDQAYRNKVLSRRFTEMTLAGELVTPEIGQQVTEQVDTDLGRFGKRRYVTGIRSFLSDIDGHVRISFTDEEFSKGDFYDNRISLIKLYGPEHPWSKAMTKRIMDEAGITPDELMIEEEQATQLPAQGSTAEVELSDNEQVAPAQQI